MTTTDTVQRRPNGRTYMPPVTCAPWCTQQDGHPRQVCRDDQWCGGENFVVGPLVADYRVPRALGGGYEEDSVTVYPRRTPGRHDTVLLWHTAADTETHLTPDEARRVASALLFVAQMIDDRPASITPDELAWIPARRGGVVRDPNLTSPREDVTR